VEGIDCCGVCAYIGADTWRCIACTEAGDECIPMGNRCCGGGSKQQDSVEASAQYSCQSTSEKSTRYVNGNTTKYTCQTTAASNAALPAGSKNKLDVQIPPVVQSAITRGEVDAKQQCIGNDEACVEGIDCCGVCAYIGADTWRCIACTEAGDECIPMGNRCCGGGSKQQDSVEASAQYSCQSTSENSTRYGNGNTTKYTCQTTDA